jgi:RNA polymerase sigma-70 factor (ECF subfamily)
MVYPLLTRRDDSFQTLWERERPRIWRLTARLSGSRDTADDLTQEIGVRAHVAYPQFRREAQASTWLYRIAVNVVLRWREQQSRSTCEGEESLSRLASSLPTAENSVLQGAQMQELYRALDTLPDELRTPLLLHAWEGLKYREIAAILEVPVGTVMSRLHTARQRLRTALKDWDDGTLSL